MGVWTLEEIRESTQGRWVIGPDADARAPMGASIDTRQIKPGQIFFVFVGEHADGHAYIDDAITAGAGMVVMTDPHADCAGCPVPVLVVEDALDAITNLAALWRSRLSARVIAVTGSNGKTTTCRMIESVLREMGDGSSSQKSFNNQLGVPITILNAKPDDAFLICELGTSSPGEIAARAALCRPDIGVIVSIGRAHLEELGSRDGVIAEKSAIAHGCIAIIPDWIDGLEDAVRAHLPERVVLVGVEEAIEVPLPGMHNRSNGALAAMVGRTMGMEEESIARGLMNTSGPPMRLERVKVRTGTDPIIVINDAYNANPDSMHASLGVLSEFDAPSRRVAVLGDMLELGGASADEHRSLSDELRATDSFDLIVLFGPVFASVARSADRVQLVEDPDDAGIMRIASMINPGDTVLIKGSRSMRLERVLDALRERFGG